MKRSTWLTVGAFFVLFGIAMLWQNSPETFKKATVTPTSYPALMPDLDEGKLNQLEFSGAETEPLMLKRNKENQWVIASLNSQKVDQGKVEELLTTIKSASVLSITQSDVDLNQIGLKNPRLVIRISRVEGNLILLKVGDPTITDSGYYVQVNEETPVVLRKATVDSIIELSQKNQLTALPTGLKLVAIPAS